MFLAWSLTMFYLIVAVDTLNYFGVLESVFRAADRALRKGGRLMFTLEVAETEDAAAGYRLNPHGRYSHTETYVRQVLSSAGLDICSLRYSVLRKEVGQPVSGMLILAQKAP